MIEYCYPECTTSAITSLAIFRKHYPHYRSEEIACVQSSSLLFYLLMGGILRQSVCAATKYLHSAQQSSGGWIGSWGICLTYATMFALESLSLVGETYATSESSRRACEFLIGKQRIDGGWGESYKVRFICLQMK